LPEQRHLFFRLRVADNQKPLTAENAENAEGKKLTAEDAEGVERSALFAFSAVNQFWKGR